VGAYDEKVVLQVLQVLRALQASRLREQQVQHPPALQREPAWVLQQKEPLP